MADETFSIPGRVIDSKRRKGIRGLRVEARGANVTGSAVTDRDGAFVIAFDKSQTEQLLRETGDEIILKLDIFQDDQLIKSTEQTASRTQGGGTPIDIVVDAPKKAKEPAPDSLQPRLVQATPEFDPAEGLKIRKADNPQPRGTLGDIGLAAEVTGPAQFPLTVLIQPFERSQLTGIDPASVRVFRWDKKSKALRPIWNSGINFELGYSWARINRPGIYVPLGLPRDRLLQEALRNLARQRALSDMDPDENAHALTKQGLGVLTQSPLEDLHDLRQVMTVIEFQTGLGPFTENEIRLGNGGHLLPFPLPGDATPEEFNKRLDQLETPAGGLPEEALFNPPDRPEDRGAPWALSSGDMPLWDMVDTRVLDRTLAKLSLRDDLLTRIRLCWFISPDWYMYHHDERHTGQASGCSDISTTNVCSMTLQPPVALPGGGTVYTIPSIVQGKIYVGTYNASDGGHLFKIDIATRAIEGNFHTPARSPAYAQGIGGSPAIVDGKVYFSNIPGRVYCLDAATFTQLWMTDLRIADPAHNQPVHNAQGDCFSSPLVVNGRVYVGSGEGESGAWGFIFCLDANTGNVIWLFCTNQFVVGTDNSPNVIPASAVGITPLPPGFSSHADPPQTGASVWSSCAYDSSLNRIYAGTGNTQQADFNPLPDFRYGSGVLSLDATTGEFRGFFQPAVSDDYRANDTDVDISSSPTLFQRGGTRVVGIGSKGGSYFLLDANTMTVLARRQLLPRDAVSGANISTVDDHTGPGENLWGVFATAAVNAGLGRLFVGLGGYGGISDFHVTPFMRALDWNTLNDAWATSVQTVGPNQVSKYTVPVPPMYTTSEAGLSSPALVDNVVFVTTSKPALYALDATTGLCLWSAPGLGSVSGGTFVLGPAVYGNYVVIGAGATLYIYKLGPSYERVRVPDLVVPWWERLFPNPPDPFFRELAERIANVLKR